MLVCFCSLAGTPACYSCSRYLEEMREQRKHLPPWNPYYPQPIVPTWPWPNRGEFTGWTCPKCGRVNAPSVTTCPCFESNEPEKAQ